MNQQSVHSGFNFECCSPAIQQHLSFRESDTQIEVERFLDRQYDFALRCYKATSASNFEQACRALATTYAHADNCIFRTAARAFD